MAMQETKRASTTAAEALRKRVMGRSVVNETPDLDTGLGHWTWALIRNRFTDGWARPLFQMP